jgi:hypothetical protein
VNYIKTSGLTHTNFTATPTRNEDGTFSAKLTFGKSGTWTINLHIVDGAEVDDQQIQITITT